MNFMKDPEYKSCLDTWPAGSESHHFFIEGKDGATSARAASANAGTAERISAEVDMAKTQKNTIHLAPKFV